MSSATVQSIRPTSPLLPLAALLVRASTPHGFQRRKLGGEGGHVISSAFMGVAPNKALAWPISLVADDLWAARIFFLRSRPSSLVITSSLLTVGVNWNDQM